MWRHHQIDRERHDLEAGKSARAVSRGDRIDERVPDHGLGVLLNQRQDAVGADRRQPGRSHHQSREHAALHIERVLRHLVDVGTVDDIGVGDQPVARGGEQAGNGPASPAWPPISASMPVGTTNTVVKRCSSRAFEDENPAPSAIAPGRPSCARPARTPTLAIDVAFAGAGGGEKRSGMASAGRFSPRWVAMCHRSRSLWLGRGDPDLLLIELHRSILFVVAAWQDVTNRAVVGQMIDAGEVLEARGPAQETTVPSPLSR